MKKLFNAIAIWAILVTAAFAQSYPSPTFNNVTVQGTLSLPNNPLSVANGGTGSGTASGARTNLGLGTAATQNTGTSGHNLPFLDGANTWSGTQTFGSAFPQAIIDGASGSNRILQFSTAGVSRWNLNVTGTESGSNTGADIQLQRRSDTGTFIDAPFSIARSTGIVTLSQPLPVASGGTGITSIGAGIATFLGTPTSANLATALTDETGSGSAVFANSPSFTTPNIGAATATSVNKVAVTAPATSATLTIANGTTLTTTSSTSVGAGQYQGTATNDNATAGNIGEFVQSEVVAGSAISLTSGTPANITSISLTAGDWDVWGDIAYAPAGSTTFTSITAAINTTSATLPTLPAGGSYSLLNLNFTTGVGQVLTAGKRRLSLSSTTTVYLISASTFSVSTMQSYGGIYARRVR